MSARRRWSRWGAVGLIAIAGAIQLVPVDRDNPPVIADAAAPAGVEAILRRACYDCHSNETRWPWYSRIAPASWFVARHVKQGRSDLNFSEWPVLDFGLQALVGSDIRKQISTGQMPLRSYTLIHADARLGDDDRERLLRWAAELETGMEQSGF